MSNPFSSFRVTPAYGSFRAVVDFTTASGYAGDVFIYRSMNGETGWKLLNPDAPLPAGTGSFADTDLPGDFNDLPYYRGLLDQGGDQSTWVPGPATAPFEYLLPQQRRGVKSILKKEFRRVSGTKSAGIRVYHFIPIEDGDTVSRFDSETGQLLGPACADEPQGYGSAFVGGFYPPLETWVRMIQAAPHQNQILDSGREDKQADITLRLLSHPRPREGHMIVMPQSDQRYVIAEPITPFYFPGTTVPIAWEAPAKLLDPSDERYQIPVEQITSEVTDNTSGLPELVPESSDP